MNNVERQYAFIQKITIVETGNEILPDNIISCDLVENSNMNGTMLMLTLNDAGGYYRDNLKVKFETEIEVTYGDQLNLNSDITIDKFVVIVPESNGKQFYIEAMQKDCYMMKKPSNYPVFFPNSTPKDILKRIVPDLKLDVDDINQHGFYHLNTGSSISRLIRSMARDYGCLAYYFRRTLCFKKIKPLLLGTAKFTFESGTNSENIAIKSFSINDREYMLKRLLDKKFIRWNTIDGMQESIGTNQDVTLITAGNKGALDNQKIAIIPTITIDTYGVSSLKPGVLSNVIIHMPYQDKVIDETLPEKQLIEMVTHHTQGNMYSCRIRLGIL